MIKLLLLFFITVISSTLAFADPTSCTLQLDNSQVDFGTLTSWNTEKKGETRYTHPQQLSINIECTEETYPYIDFMAIGSSLTNYQFTKSATILLEANNATLDGKRVSIQSIDLNSSDRKKTSDTINVIRPETRLTPYSQKKGRIFSFTLLISLKIDSLGQSAPLEHIALPLMTEGNKRHLSITYSPISTACNLIIDNSVVDYGVIAREEIKNQSYTLLPEKRLNYSIQCDSGQTAIALQAFNQIENTLAPDRQEGIGGYGPAPITLLNHAKMMAGGLGTTAENEPIGGYAVALEASSLLLDDKYQATPIVSYASCGDVDKSWQYHNGNLLAYNTKNMIVSWAKEGTLQPALFSNMKGSIRIQAFINKASSLTINKSIKFKGRTIIEACYL